MTWRMALTQLGMADLVPVAPQNASGAKPGDSYQNKLGGCPRRPNRHRHVISREAQSVLVGNVRTLLAMPERPLRHFAQRRSVRDGNLLHVDSIVRNGVVARPLCHCMARYVIKAISPLRTICRRAGGAASKEEIPKCRHYPPLLRTFGFAAPEDEPVSLPSYSA